jgi:hypothetical protein
MPDGRFLSKRIAWSDQVNGVSLEADYLFMRMIPHLDREGRVSGSAKAIKAMTCPLRDEMTSEKVESALCELADAGLIVRYTADDGTECVSFPGFLSHQRGARLDREAPSRVPSPPATPRSKSATSRRRSASTRSRSGPTPELVRVSEVKGSEVKQSEVKGASAGAEPDTSGSDPDRPPPGPPALALPSPEDGRQRGGGWPDRISAVLAQRGINAPPGKVGGMLKVAVDHFTERRITRALVGFLDNGVTVHGEKPGFVTLARFCENPGHWVKMTTPANELPKAERDALLREAAGLAS